MAGILSLAPGDLAEVEALIQSTLARVQDEEHLHRVCAHSALRLPLAIRELLTGFRMEDVDPFICLAGFTVDDAAIGPTPATTRRAPAEGITREDVYLSLIASALGVPFSFSTQQAGHLIQNIAPMRSAEFSQLGAGSRQALVWHTEDAFSPHRPDYIVLLGMRNPHGTPTTLGELPDSLSAEDRDLLFRKNFRFLPDPDHAEHLKDATSTAGRAAYHRMRTLIDNPPCDSVLFGDRQRPYLRLDPAFTTIVADSDPSVPVYHRVVREIEDGQRDFVIGPGDLLIIDNHRAVHGRRAFNPRYDGRDRWLKKINVTLDFKKMRADAIHERSFVV